MENHHNSVKEYSKNNFLKIVIENAQMLDMRTKDGDEIFNIIQFKKFYLSENAIEQRHNFWHVSVN